MATGRKTDNKKGREIADRQTSDRDRDRERQTDKEGINSFKHTLHSKFIAFVYGS